MCIHPFAIKELIIYPYICIMIASIAFGSESDTRWGYSIAMSELEVFSDSSSVAAWTKYANSLFVHGWICRAGEVFEIALSIDPDNSMLVRTAAAYFNTTGQSRRAVELLSACSSDSLVQIMLVCLLQSTGFIDQAAAHIDFLLETPDDFLPGIHGLLSARQARLTGNILISETVLDSIWFFCDEDILPLIAMEDALCNGRLDRLSEEDLHKFIESDITYTGGVYLNSLLGYIESTESMSSDILSTLLLLTGMHEQAAVILSSNSASLPQKLIAAEIYIHCNMFSRAEVLIGDALLQEPDNLQAIYLHGMLLLRSNNNAQAFTVLDNLPDSAFHPGCIALKGLAAERLGNTTLAVEIYSQLLGMSADSIIVINRNRDAVLHPYLLDSFQDRNRQARHLSSIESSNLHGNLSLYFNDCSGEYSYSNLSVNSNILYRWGLYNSNLSFASRYSFNKWPNTSDNSSQLSSSLTAVNYSSFDFSQMVKFAADFRRSDSSSSRNSFQATGSVGYNLTPMSDFLVIPYIGLGKIYDYYDDDAMNRDHWIIRPQFTIRFAGDVLSSFLPVAEISLVYNSNLDSVGYDYSLSGSINFYRWNRVSVGVGYNIDKSIQPESNYTFRDRSYYVSMSYRI